MELPPPCPELRHRRAGDLPEVGPGLPRVRLGIIVESLYRIQVEAAIEGEALTVAFNARYLQEALANLDAQQLTLEFTGPLSPGVLKPVGDDGYVHVIMPVRTPS